MTHSERRKSSKQHARLSLKGNWGKSILIWLLLIAISIGISVLSMATLYAASPDDYNIAVTPNGIHTSSAQLTERGQYQVQQMVTEFLETLENEQRFDLSVFYAPETEVSHTSSTGTAIISAFSVLSVIITVPLSFGIYNFYVKMCEGTKPMIGDMFSFFGSGKKFVKCFLLSLLVAVYTTLWGALFYTILAVCVGAAFAALYFAGAELSAYVVAGFISLAAYIVVSLLYVVFLNRYEAASQVFVKDGVTAKVVGSVKASVSAMKGHLWETFVFNLSFIGWFLLVAVTFGLAAFYVVPYYQAASVAYLDNLLGWKKEDKVADDVDDAAAPEIPDFNEFLPKE